MRLISRPLVVFRHRRLENESEYFLVFSHALEGRIVLGPKVGRGTRRRIWSITIGLIYPYYVPLASTVSNISLRFVAFPDVLRASLHGCATAARA